MEEYEDGLQCRSCLSITSAEYIHMESGTERGCTYLECFNICTNLKADIDDELPCSICVTCLHDLQVAYNFVNVARQSDAFLRKHLQRERQHHTAEALKEVELVSTEDCEVDAKEIDILDVSQIDIIQEEDDYECEEFETVEGELEVEDIKIETDLAESSHLESEVKKELQECSSPQSSEDEDEEYLIEYDADNLGSSQVMLKNKGLKWKCIECKRILRGDVSYEGHMNMHKNIKPYKCSKCSKAYRCRFILEQHVSKRHVAYDTHISCDLCEHIFSSFEILHEHQQTDHQTQSENSSNFLETKVDTSNHTGLISLASDNDLIQCSYCTQPPFEKSEFYEHIRLEHPSEYNENINANENHDDKNIKAQWQCDICFQHFRSKSMLKSHRHTHTGERPFPCAVCGKGFVSAKGQRVHMRKFHQEEFKKYIAETEEEQVTCEICKKNFFKKNIEKHLESHDRKEKESLDGNLKYLCAFCPRECKNQKTLNHHEKLHETEKSGVVYKCVECDRQYASKQHLVLHCKQAHKERDNICPICGNAFKLKNQLVNHMKLHLEKNIPCPHCDKKYARLFDLNVHIRSHTGELPYACHLCEKRFAIKVRLTYHLQKHMGIKHRCKECGAEFNSKQKLKAHSYKHTGMPYRCEMCDNHGFANRDVFKRHLLRVHNATMSDELLVAMFQRNTGKSTRIQTIDKDDQYVFISKDDNIDEICNDEICNDEICNDEICNDEICNDEINMVEEVV